MGDSDSTTPSWINDAIRNVVSFIFDQPAYWLLGLIYQLFFNVASADLFSNETIMHFYGRVQIILGVFMMFQLAMTILRGIVNPDSFTDSKNGAGNFITRVATSLILITLMMPISTPGRNEYERQVNNNGIIFGTLYSLQHRILANNTIGRLVLGTNDTNATYMSDDDTELKKSSRIFSSTILKAFYRINLIPESSDSRVDTGDKDPASATANRYCPDYDYTAYLRVDAEPSEIIAMVDEACDQSSIPVVGGVIDQITGSGHYVLTYHPIVSAIVAYVFAFILLSFTIDVAVRAVKLAVLRLIAPIPLISYMDPKGGKDSAFNAWVKLLTSTYLDLFIRLAAVYFVIFLIQDMMYHGIYMNYSGGLLGVLSFIIICIGLFIFAKQAPKFVKQAIGMKDDGGKLFSGFKELAAVGAIGAGVVGGGISRGIGTATNTNGNLGKKIAAGIGGGIAGAVSGGVSTGRTYWGQKEADRKALMNHVRSNNARNYSNAADDSTPFGRFVAGLQANAGFRNDLQKMDDKIKYFGAAKDALGRMNDAFNSNGDYKSVYNGPDIRDNSGNMVLQSGQAYSLKDFKDKLGRVQASGNEHLIKSVDDAMKAAQGERLNHLRSTFTGRTREEARAKLVEAIEQSARLGNTDYTQRDLDVFDGAYTIYNVSQMYSNEPFFADYRGKSFSDTSVSWSRVKKAASTAGDTSKSIKASPEYDRAKANAQRAEQQSKK